MMLEPIPLLLAFAFANAYGYRTLSDNLNLALNMLSIAYQVTIPFGVNLTTTPTLRPHKGQLAYGLDTDLLYVANNFAWNPVCCNNPPPDPLREINPGRGNIETTRIKHHYNKDASLLRLEIQELQRRITKLEDEAIRRTENK